ncbi:MAG: hypothetical protein U1F43_34145 [Myxococcota bacterium]
MIEAIDAFLAENPRLLKHDPKFDVTVPWVAALLAEAMTTGPLPMPAELAHFYRRSGPVGHRRLSDDVELFGAQSYVEVNGVPVGHLPPVVFVADDGGSGFYFIDALGGIEGRPGTVYWTARSSYRRRECVRCADDFVAFLRRARAGERMTNGPSLTDLAIARMHAAFDAHPDAWDGKPGNDTLRVYLNVDALGFDLPQVLVAILRRADGLRFAQSGIVLLPSAELGRVPGTEVPGWAGPGALWFARAPDGTRFALTWGQGWRDLEPEQVLAVAPGVDIAVAPVLGWLPDVVLGWLGAER